MNKIYFSIPGLYRHSVLIAEFIELFFKEREKFYDDVVIKNVYGSFPCIWNSGQWSYDKQYSQEDIKVATKYLNGHNIKVRCTFTNNQLKNNDFFDQRSLEIIETISKNASIENEILFFDEKLTETLKNNFNNFGYIKDLENIESVEKITDERFVLNNKFNHDFNILNKLQKNNVELIVNSSCFDDCVIKKECFKQKSLNNLLEETSLEQCVYNKNNFNYQRKQKGSLSHISIDEIRKSYLPIGIDKFTIDGRGESPLYVIEGIVEYLVKDKYKNDIRDELLRMYFPIDLAHV